MFDGNRVADKVHSDVDLELDGVGVLLPYELIEIGGFTSGGLGKYKGPRCPHPYNADVIKLAAMNLRKN
jgi:hypothetical protein